MFEFRFSHWWIFGILLLAFPQAGWAAKGASAPTLKLLKAPTLKVR